MDRGDEVTRFAVEELEERLEMATLVTLEEEAPDAGCCSGSCCLVGGDCKAPQ